MRRRSPPTRKFYSTNEEFKTAKEELQSANEELGVTNQELRNRNRELTDLNDELRHSRSYQDAVAETLREALLISTATCGFRKPITSFTKRFIFFPQDTLQRYLYDLGNGQWNIPELRELLEGVLPKGSSPMRDFEVTHDFREIGEKTMLLNVTGCMPRMVAISSSCSRSRIFRIARFPKRNRRKPTVAGTTSWQPLRTNSEIRWLRSATEYSCCAATERE